jgi:hypothetical protein
LHTLVVRRPFQQYLFVDLVNDVKFDRNFGNLKRNFSSGHIFIPFLLCLCIPCAKTFTLTPTIIRAPPYGGCPIVISLSVRACVRACVRPKWSFPGFFSTPFHIGSWNFPWGSSELSYASSSRFIIVTPMVPELRALRFFTIGHMHVTVFRGFFLHRFI